MIVRAAVVPELPALLPGATGRPVPEVEEIRDAARDAVRWVLAAEPDAVVTLAGDADTRSWSADAPARSAGYLGAPAPAASLPLGLSVLRALAPDDSALHRQSVAVDTIGIEAARLGARLADTAARVGLLVAGDGSARRTLKAPGYLDDRAVGFDDVVDSALTAGDAAALLGLDVALAADLLVAGRAAWQVLAGAVGDRPVRASVAYRGDPFGVQYWVARWQLD